MFWLTDATMTHFHYVSPAFEQVWGRRCASLYADPDVWIDAVEPEHRARVIAMRGDTGRLEIEFRIGRPDGSVRWISSRSFPVRDGSGAVVRIAGVAMDVTEHKRLEEQLVQTQKLESLGLLAGGIAHDFNNLLAVVATNASMLSTAVPEGSDDRELRRPFPPAARVLAQGSDQADRARPQRGRRHTRKMLRRMLGEDIVLETSLDPEIRRVLIDPGHLVQILMNLAVNARDAMPGGGKLEIQTRTLDARVALSIRDDGESITLPEVDAPAETAPELADAIARGHETVLVVDDDPHVRQAVTRALRASGYTVHEARDGQRRRSTSWSPMS